MKILCPNCGVKGSADDSYCDRRVRCPKCRHIFVVHIDMALAPELVVEPDAIPESSMTPAAVENLEPDSASEAVDIQDFAEGEIPHEDLAGAEAEVGEAEEMPATGELASGEEEGGGIEPAVSAEIEDEPYGLEKQQCWQCGREEDAEGAFTSKDGRLYCPGCLPAEAGEEADSAGPVAEKTEEPVAPEKQPPGDSLPAGAAAPSGFSISAFINKIIGSFRSK
jgi:hypothetical protein